MAITKMALAWAVLGAACIWAQQPSNPAELGTGALTREDALRSNTLTFGVSSSSAFDDNAQGSLGKSNITSSIQPQVGLAIVRPRLQSRLYFSPGYTFSSDVASQSGTSQTVRVEGQYLFSPRLSLNLRGSFLNTSNPVDNVRAGQESPQLGILERPSDLFIGSRIHQTNEQMSSDIVYRMAQYTSIGFGGAFGNSIYRSTDEGGGSVRQTFRSQTWSANSFLSHRLTPRYSIGANYIAQNFSSAQAVTSTLTHSVLGFTTISITQHVQLSFFAGPEFSRIDSGSLGNVAALSEGQTTSLSYGSTFNWQGERNGLAASFAQRVSDSIGTGNAAVRAKMVNFRAARQITRRVALNAFANYVSNSALQGGQVTATPDSVGGGLGVSRSLTQAISISILAFHQDFLSPVAFLPGATGHNVVSASVSYSFERPIGR